MSYTPYVPTLPNEARVVPRLSPNWRDAVWAWVRLVAAIAALAYLVAGAAIPWLLLEAPPSPYPIAGVPARCDALPAEREPCPTGDADH
jgi:hypothetical protein